MEQHAFQRWRDRLFGLKRDWLDLIAEAEAEGRDEEASELRVQLEKISGMIEQLGGDPRANPPRRLDS